MTDRYCPYCGELVPSNSVTCPKCFRKVPDEPGAPRHEEHRERTEDRTERHERREEPRKKEKQKREYSSQAALALDVIPGFLGLLGLGQIYRDYKSMKGWFLLLLGLVLFTTGMMLLLHWTPSFLVNFFSSISAFPIFIIYTLLYIFAVADILMGKLFRFGH